MYANKLSIVSFGKFCYSTTNCKFQIRQNFHAKKFVRKKHEKLTRINQRKINKYFYSDPYPIAFARRLFCRGGAQKKKKFSYSRTKKDKKCYIL